jgi:hypothetical protein
MLDHSYCYHPFIIMLDKSCSGHPLLSNDGQILFRSFYFSYCWTNLILAICFNLMLGKSYSGHPPCFLMLEFFIFLIFLYFFLFFIMLENCYYGHPVLPNAGNSYSGRPLLPNAGQILFWPCSSA